MVTSGQWLGFVPHSTVTKNNNGIVFSARVQVLKANRYPGLDFRRRQ